MLSKEEREHLEWVRIEARSASRGSVEQQVNFFDSGEVLFLIDLIDRLIEGE